MMINETHNFLVCILCSEYLKKKKERELKKWLQQLNCVIFPFLLITILTWDKLWIIKCSVRNSDKALCSLHSKLFFLGMSCQYIRGAWGRTYLTNDHFRTTFGSTNQRTNQPTPFFGQMTNRRTTA